MDELLEKCHLDLFLKLQVQDDPELSTKGTYTEVKGKRCPSLLAPWHDFPTEQTRVFKQIHDGWHPSSGAIRYLPSLQGIIDKAKFLVGIISSEEDLKRFHYKVVEEYVEIILNTMVSKPELKGHFEELGDGFRFENQIFKKYLARGHSEVEKRREQLAREATTMELREKAKGKGKAFPSTPVNKSSKAQDRTAKDLEPSALDIPILNADQYLITWAHDKAKLVVIEELKAPHKLTQQFIMLGLVDPKTGELGTLDVSKVRNRQR